MPEFELIFNKFRNNKMVFNKIKEETKYYIIMYFRKKN